MQTTHSNFYSGNKAEARDDYNYSSSKKSHTIRPFERSGGKVDPVFTGRASVRLPDANSRQEELLQS